MSDSGGSSLKTLSSQHISEGGGGGENELDEAAREGGDAKRTHERAPAMPRRRSLSKHREVLLMLPVLLRRLRGRSPEEEEEMKGLER